MFHYRRIPYGLIWWLMILSMILGAIWLLSTETDDREGWRKPDTGLCTVYYQSENGVGTMYVPCR